MLQFLLLLKRQPLPDCTHSSCLFVFKDSHRFGKNIQEAMVDIMGLFNHSKNCTKWFAVSVQSNLLLLEWGLFWTVNESKACQTIAGEEAESQSYWSSMKTLAVAWMFHDSFFSNILEEFISTKGVFWNLVCF